MVVDMESVLVVWWLLRAIFNYFTNVYNKNMSCSFYDDDRARRWKMNDKINSQFFLMLRGKSNQAKEVFEKNKKLFATLNGFQCVLGKAWGHSLFGRNLLYKHICIDPVTQALLTRMKTRMIKMHALYWLNEHGHILRGAI